MPTKRQIVFTTNDVPIDLNEDILAKVSPRVGRQPGGLLPGRPSRFVRARRSKTMQAMTMLYCLVIALLATLSTIDAFGTGGASGGLFRASISSKESRHSNIDKMHYMDTDVATDVSTTKSGARSMTMMPLGVPKVAYRMPGSRGGEWVDIYQRLTRERIVFMGSEIDDEMANQIIGVLLVSR